MLGLKHLRTRKELILTVLIAIATLGQTIDATQMTNLITSMIPLIIALISIAIPLVFLKYIMKLLEKVLGGFS
ncbi:MAG: hypothetical protein QXM43_02405 [Desulfurococcaceae archaeon]